ncbi:outer membrane transport energization protein TonB [Psychromonas ingrahamii 37]|uniref:Outer membrane transport energization protein TonB n=1 Tax=Psychromonas ingrahamii (strain DSM 17664 / CCUG 51855 / 37) TaxID=357804 RepID=A1SZW8_PSYIN|nr:energy transducer TonB [Psychromonas ingrahamii]ABM05033.1 outer membrane transport energization protein TonB [Psychromonas ingrahamii 37]
MKIISSYFPFLIISLVFYGFIFLYLDQPKRITTLPLNSGEQSVQVQFISQPNKGQNPAEDKLAAPTEQKIVEAKSYVTEEEVVERAKVKSKKVIKYSAKSLILSESEIKLRKQALLESFATAGTDNVAKLKAEIFLEQLATEKILTNETEQLSKTKDQASSPQTSNGPAKKAVIKKSPSENSSSLASSTKNQGVLQEAIVVSGRKPVYPQRAILRNQQGRVVIKLTITKKGLPKNPKILTSSGFPLLDDAVLAFVDQELFMPALQGEDQVMSEQLFAFRFELN